LVSKKQENGRPPKNMVHLFYKWWKVNNIIIYFRCIYD